MCNEGVGNMGAGSLGEVLRVIDKYVIQILDLSTLGLQNVKMIDLTFGVLVLFVHRQSQEENYPPDIK